MAPSVRAGSIARPRVDRRLFPTRARGSSQSDDEGRDEQNGHRDHRRPRDRAGGERHVEAVDVGEHDDVQAGGHRRREQERVRQVDERRGEPEQHERRDQAAQQDRHADLWRERRGELHRALLGLLGQRDADREEAQHRYAQHEDVGSVDEHIGRQRLRGDQGERDRDQRRVADEERADPLRDGLAGLRAGRGGDRERTDEEHRLLHERVVGDGLGHVAEAQDRAGHGDAHQPRVRLQADDRQHARRRLLEVQDAAPDQPADQCGERERGPAEDDAEADVGVHLKPRDVEERDQRHDHVQQELQDAAGPDPRPGARVLLRLHPRRDRGGDGEGDPEHRGSVAAARFALARGHDDRVAALVGGLVLHQPARQRGGPADVEALHVVDAEVAHQRHRLLVADHLGDRALAEPAGDVHDRLDHELVGAVGHAAAHELAVDLQVVERQVLEVVERREGGAEVVEREAAAERGEAVGELLRARDVRDGGGLGDLEDHLRRVDLVGAQFALDQRQQLGVTGRPARDVDLEREATAAAVLLGQLSHYYLSLFV